MRFLWLVVLGLVLVPVCVAQKARVVFYSDAYGVKSTAAGLAPVSTQPFPGWLYEGEEKLAPFRAGRFVVLDFEPGMHVFMANHSSDPSSPSVLALNLEAGSTHCVRLSAAAVNWYVVGIMTYHGRIEEVSCDAVAGQVQKMKTLDTKKMPKPALDRLDPVQEAPAVTKPQPPAVGPTAASPPIHVSQVLMVKESGSADLGCGIQSKAAQPGAAPLFDAGCSAV